jgi:hypothetical protein
MEGATGYRKFQEDSFCMSTPDRSGRALIRFITYTCSDKHDDAIAGKIIKNKRK